VKRTLSRTAAIAVVVITLALAAQAAELKVGDRVPDFSLPDQNGNTVKLSDYLGKKNLVLAFYVLAFTNG